MMRKSERRNEETASVRNDHSKKLMTCNIHTSRVGIELGKDTSSVARASSKMFPAEVW